MAQRPALGKGLGALLGDIDATLVAQEPRIATVTVAADSPVAVNEIALDKIVPNPFQPRLNFDEEALSELSESIRTLGIIQPLTLREMPEGRYQIISGERRFRAARMAGLTQVPAYIRKADDAAMLEMAIVENIQRENLDAIETALGFQRLIDECSLTQEAMALRVGKKRATITNYLRLLNLPPEIQKAIKENAISAGHAKALLSLDNPKAQIRLCNQTVKGGWSVRTLEEKVRKLLEEKKTEKVAAPGLPESYTRLKGLFESLGSGVSVKRSEKGGGSLTVRFKDDSETEKFLDALEKFNR